MVLSWVGLESEIAFEGRFASPWSREYLCANFVTF